ncbi:hypothetical protein [uncultured Megasphaera sp.]|uniref:hypothetical protein n=1 Tax=Megasphaera massiliensis TaxID=1232428 RepID=UPI00266C1EBE|nr:hypothetical protein [uncultured Megasphaera sp.]
MGMEEKNKGHIPVDENDEKQRDIVTTFAAGEAAKAAADGIEDHYSKPQEYNRHNYDDGKAKYEAKKKVFKKGNGTAKDPYTNQKIVMHKKDAKLELGKDYRKILAEADHTIPLKVLHELFKNNPFLTVEDIKQIANSDGNLLVIGGSFNAAKGSKTNSQLALKIANSPNMDLSKRAEVITNLLWEETKAGVNIGCQAGAGTVQNAVGTFNNVGVEGGVSAGSMVAVMSSINNIGQVLSGDKEAEEAFRDAAKATGTAAIDGYLRSGGIATATQIMRSSTNNLIKALGKMNAPANVLSAVAVAGSALSRYCSGEITAEECMIELQRNAVTLAASTAGMAVSESIFMGIAAGTLFVGPLALLGAAVGAMAATAVVGFVEDVVLAPYYNAKAARKLEERRTAAFNRVSAAMEAALEAQGKRLDAMYEEEKGRQYEAFYLGFERMMDSALEDDVDNITGGLNQILSYFGEECYFKDRESFNQYFDSKDRKPFVL